MTDDKSLPPIASPHGGGTVPVESEAIIASGEVSVAYSSLSLYGGIRMAAKVMVATPTYAVGELFILPFLPLVFPVACLANFLVPILRGRSTTSLNAEGLRETASFLSSSIRWKRILWVLDWGGDLCFCTIGGGCYIPREAFASREEASEFAAIARDLKQNGASAWRPEWNNRAFGVHTDEGETFSIPR